MFWLKIKNTINFYKLCFLNWCAGNGFRIPEPNLKLKYFFEYCESITNHTLKNPTWAYEEELAKHMFNTGIPTREEVAKNFIKVYKEIFEEGKPW